MQMCAQKRADCSTYTRKVKSDRSQRLSQIQAAQQAEAEIKEKLRVLGNETDILRAESTVFDRKLTRTRLLYENAVAARTALWNEINKVTYQRRLAQQRLDRQIFRN